MEKRLDLTEGAISGKLIKLAVPIMGTSFIQMAYNLIDMMCIGRAGSDAVAAVGTAGFFTWLAMAFVAISKVGAEVKVAQCIGEKNDLELRKYVTSSFQINIVLAIVYMILMLLFKNALIGFFRLGDEKIVSMAKTYLTVMAVGMVFTFINPVFTGALNGAGNSKAPFIINTIGLITNIILDMILIFGLGPIPKLGVLGAAVATITAQILVTCLFIIVLLTNKKFAMLRFNILDKPSKNHIVIVFKLGIPVALHEGLFSIFSMTIGRIISVWGPVPIAVQKVGAQIEAISWMTAVGFATSLGTFVGQNYGAKKYNRIHKGFKVTMSIATIVGIITSVLLIFFGEFIFKAFINEPEAIKQGVTYLRIQGYSQLFMCLEITASGAFNGVGKTYIPSIIGIVLTGARVPFAYVLSKPQFFGINGVWWSISISSILKGLVLVGIYVYLYKSKRLYKQKEINIAETI